MTSLFISDLHLEAGRPQIGEQFVAFLDGEAREAEALYILGDLFEYWVGDDDPNPYYAQMKAAIRALSDSGQTVYFMHGNRDFAIGEKFADETGVTLLADPTKADLYGQSVVLSHGDALCTDDVEYQKVRTMTRNPEWLAMIMTKPLAERIAFAEHARQQSKARGDLAEEIMDVNQGAVEEIFGKYDVDILLHGHTHRPAVHDVKLSDRVATRIVLGDWYEQGSVLRWDENGPRLEEMLRF
jgi:UDP-2,3-diacylglucosamine hydrolase